LGTFAGYVAQLAFATKHRKAIYLKVWPHIRQALIMLRNVAQLLFEEPEKSGRLCFAFLICDFGLLVLPFWCLKVE